MESTLDSTTHTASSVSARQWAGRALTGLSVLFLTFDAAIKLIGHPEVDKASVELGLPLQLAPRLGVLMFGCLLLHVIPRTALIGAVLLTGYLGGAVLTHVRVESPLFSHTLFPIYVGTMVWAGLFLRDERFRRLLTQR